MTGESIKFDYNNTEDSYHNVKKVSKQHFEDCRIANMQGISTDKEDGPQTIEMGDEVKVSYFICTVNNRAHCNPQRGNQRLMVNVSNDCPTDGKSYILYLINTILFLSRYLTVELYQ